MRTRVLMLATRVPLRSGDGTPSFVLDAAEAVSGEADVVLLAPRIRNAPRRLKVGRVEVMRFSYAPQRWERLADDAIMPQLATDRHLWIQAISLGGAMIVSAMRIHRRIRPDVVHAQWIMPAGIVALLMRMLFGTPYVLTARGADAYVLDGGVVARVRRLVVARADRFVAVSGEIRDRFVDVNPSGSVQPSGVNIELWRRLIGPREPEACRLLFVGRLTAKKGVGILLEAVATLPSVHLIVVGDGPDRDSLIHRSELLGVGERVRFVGRANREEIAAEYRRAAALVIPSVIAPDGDREGTPNVLAEAIVTGVPVIASALAGIAEFIEDRSTGLLFTPGDASDLRRAILEATEDMARMDEYATRACERHAEALSLERSAARYAQWYSELATRG